MDMPQEIIEQRNAAAVAQSEQNQWAYAVAYALLQRKARKGKAREDWDRKVSDMAGMVCRHCTLSLDTLKLRAAYCARNKRPIQAASLVRAVIRFNMTGRVK
jgi:hypothetical protein